MEETKKISVNAFEKVMNDTYTDKTTYTWNGIEVTVTRTLSLSDMIEFVNDVVSSCFAEENGAYMPEIKDFVTKVCVLEKYANFTMPRNIHTQYALVSTTDAVASVLEHVNLQQFNEIVEAIDEKLAHRSQANIEAVHKQMNELYSNFNNLQNTLADIFSGVQSDDMKAVINAVSNGTLSEEKLVDAYMNKKAEQSGDSSGTN